MLYHSSYWNFADNILANTIFPGRAVAVNINLRSDSSLFPADFLKYKSTVPEGWLYIITTFPAF